MLVRSDTCGRNLKRKRLGYVSIRSRVLRSLRAFCVRMKNTKIIMVSSSDCTVHTIQTISTLNSDNTGVQVFNVELVTRHTCPRKSNGRVATTRQSCLTELWLNDCGRYPHEKSLYIFQRLRLECGSTGPELAT